MGAMPTIVRITSAGLAAAIAASGSGLQLALTHMALGGTAFNPTGAETALPDIRETQTLAGGSVISGASFTVNTTFPSRVGATYTARSVGIYAGTPGSGGVLFAVASATGEDLATRFSGGSTYTPSITVQLTGVPDGSVTITIDPTQPAAAALLAAHLAAADPHPQYIKAIGMVADFLARTAPRGWLECNGQTVLRASYPELWAHAQDEAVVVTEAVWAATSWFMFSNGNGSTTFRLPDLRGEFRRTADRGRGIDPGRNMFTFQGDEFRSHVHGVATSGTDLSGSFIADGSSPNINTSSTQATGGVETRPRNGSFLTCVYAGRATVPVGPSPAPSPAPVPAPAPGPVGSPPPPGPPAPAGSPGVNFTVTTTTIGLGDFLDFTDTSSNSPTGWAWTFGDGGTSTAQNPQYRYYAPGVYTVSLTASNALGSNTLTRTNYITVIDSGGSGLP